MLARATTFTVAHSVALGQDSLDPRLQDILCNPACKSKIFPIVTPLKADNWERQIKEAELEATYGDIPNCICYGFSHGLDRAQTARTTYIPDNLKSALEHPKVISAYLEKEQALGRISEVYDPEFLESQIGPFRRLHTERHATWQMVDV
jgi:hypothetical protein